MAKRVQRVEFNDVNGVEWNCSIRLTRALRTLSLHRTKKVTQRPVIVLYPKLEM